MAKKVCKNCGVEKDLTDFPCHRNVCKECSRIRNNEYSRARNIRDREKVNARNFVWATNHREHELERRREYGKEHRSELSVLAKRCREAKPEQYRASARRRASFRREHDLDFRMKDVLRKRMRNALLGLTKTSRTMDLLGCSLEELKQHLEMAFREGMSWENYGKFGWHIDHIIPCSSFNLSDPEEQKKCFHFTNLQPLWAKENWSKGSKVVKSA